MMLTTEDTATLRPEEKDAILDAILGMAWSDGSVHADEVSMVKRIAALLTEKDVDALLKDYKPDNERVSTKIAKSDLGPAGKRIMLRAMAYVAAAEGSLDDKELAFYRGCLRAFGVPERERVRMEREVRQAVFSDIWKRRLRAGELDDAAKAELETLRKRLEIDDAAAQEIEKSARRAVALA